MCLTKFMESNIGPKIEVANHLLETRMNHMEIPVPLKMTNLCRNVMHSTSSRKNNGDVAATLFLKEYQDIIIQTKN